MLESVGVGGKLTVCCQIFGFCLSTLATNASGQLDVLGHDGDTLGVNGAQVSVFEQTDKVGLACFLEGTDSSALETQVSLEILGNFTNKTLEWQFADQQFSRFLVTTNFTKSNSTRPI